MDNDSLYFHQVEIDDRIPSLEKAINIVDMVMYGGATWDFHRIHYDTQYVQELGFPKPFVDGQMLGGFLAQLIVDWIGPHGCLKKLMVRYTAMAFPGDILTCEGQVLNKYILGEECIVETTLWIENQRRERVVDQATATVSLPTGKREK